MTPARAVALLAALFAVSAVSAATGCTAPTASAPAPGAAATGRDDDAALLGGRAAPAGPLFGHIDAAGGTFSTLYFAVVGDTRPPGYDDTADYPAGEITRIYADIAALDPRPEFVVATGDYMFATNGADEGRVQMAIYAKAASQWPGPLFAVLGNHECDTLTATNCAGGMATTKNMAAFMDALVKPLHRAKPYYAVHFEAFDDPGLSVNLVVTACNAWDRAQRDFFAAALAEQATYTVVVRHEPGGDLTAPCVPDEDAMMAAHPVDLLITGHVHSFEHRDREIIVGNGGAPPVSSQPYGFATVELVPGDGFRVVQYDAASAAPIAAFLVR